MYLFETLPIPIPRGELRSMKAMMLHFIWLQKRHRISKSILLAPKTRGGCRVSAATWSSLFTYTRWIEIEPPKRSLGVYLTFES